MNTLIIIITIVGLLIDQVSKFIISYLFELNHSIKLINNFLSFTYKHNYGAAWGILSGLNILFILMALIGLYLIYKYIDEFKSNKRNKIAFGFLLAGISGNLIDRIFFGYVRDFIDVKIFNYNFPIFNLADSLIVIGAILIIFAIIKGEDKREN
ncbi:MAG: signal peptidase II [Mollicutes bacterium]|nr:signal peptidase II [Mollicutes bacterium]